MILSATIVGVMECLITQTRVDNTSPDEMIKNKDYAMQANSCLGGNK